MPVAVGRTIDAAVLDAVSSAVGRSRHRDAVAAAAAAHLAKLHVALLAMLLVGGPGAAGRRRREVALRMCIGLLLTLGAVSGIGRMVRRSRPFVARDGVTSLVEHGEGRSFPSRHSACAAVMATVALPSAPWFGMALATGALGLAVSRIYAGLHYPTDILGGWAIGIAVGLLVRRRERMRAREN